MNAKTLVVGGLLAASICAYPYIKPLEHMDGFMIHAHAGAYIADAHVRTGANSYPVHFEYPMVIGGIHDIDNLARNVRLYPGLNLAAARFGRLERSEWAYVSYSKDGHTYWTKHKRFIPAGTEIITDGNIIILVHCGNMIKTDETPIDPTLANEPGEVYPPEIDDPGAPSNLGATLGDSPPINGSLIGGYNGSTEVFSNLNSCVGCGVFFGIPPSPPVTKVPEVSTSALVVLGLFVVFLVLPSIMAWLVKDETDYFDYEEDDDDLDSK